MKLSIHIDMTHPRLQEHPADDAVFNKLQKAVNEHLNGESATSSDVFWGDDERPFASITTSAI